MLAKRNRIIGNLKSKYWVQAHNFSVKIPKSVQESNEFDEENGNKLWWDGICKKMKNIRPAFEVWEKDISELPPGYQNITCNMIFDVKMGKIIRRKARFIADRHKTKTSSGNDLLISGVKGLSLDRTKNGSAQCVRRVGL